MKGVSTKFNFAYLTGNDKTQNKKRLLTYPF